jgi:hypothetical protein
VRRQHSPLWGTRGIRTPTHSQVSGRAVHVLHLRYTCRVPDCALPKRYGQQCETAEGQRDFDLAHRPIACAARQLHSSCSLKDCAPRRRLLSNTHCIPRAWTKELGVSPDELKSAVQKVGPSVKAVREHLRVIEPAASLWLFAGSVLSSAPPLRAPTPSRNRGTVQRAFPVWPHRASA